MSNCFGDCKWLHADYVGERFKCDLFGVFLIEEKSSSIRCSACLELGEMAIAESEAKDEVF